MLRDEMYKPFGIRPNQLGLIDQPEDARQVNEYLRQTGAELAIWEPWLLLDFCAGVTPPLALRSLWRSCYKFGQPRTRGHQRLTLRQYSS